ncbi:MAG: glycosyltransferase family 2 protein [Pseudomonadota bacterium]|nr:glycosyltransferase family 2 protein [Pseudomonadota bacterium]
MIDVSVVVTLHREGRIAVAALRSAAAAIAAAPELNCEILVVIDRGDEAAARAVARFGDAARVEHVDFGDPALARNFGVAQARGAHIAFLDGDDLMGENWLAVAARQLRQREGRDVVVHPRLNYVFGRDAAPIAWLHPDMETDCLDMTLLRAGNFWTSATFARADLHRRFPFAANALEAGFGHEDWTFNLATVRAGVTHVAPEGTVHFVRRKEGGGRLAQSAAQRILPNLAI